MKGGPKYSFAYVTIKGKSGPAYEYLDLGKKSRLSVLKRS